MCLHLPCVSLMTECAVCCLSEGHFIFLYLMSFCSETQALICSSFFLHIFLLLDQMEEEEEERLRRPPIIPEPEPVEERECHRASRNHREHRQNQERERPAVHKEQEIEEGEEEDYDNDIDNAETKPCLKPTMRPITAAPSVSSASGNVSPNTPGEESPCGIIIPHENSPPDALPLDENRPKFGLSLKLGESSLCI